MRGGEGEHGVGGIVGGEVEDADEDADGEGEGGRVRGLIDGDGAVLLHFFRFVL